MVDIAVVGAGTMGAGIAESAALAGMSVAMLDVREEALERGRQTIERDLERRVKKGRLSEDERREVLGRVSTTTSVEDCSETPLVIEAAVEDIEVKKKVFADFESVVGDEAVLATNTSSLSVAGIAAATNRPQRVVGMHFFNPVPAMRLVEVVAGPSTDPSALRRAEEVSEGLGKTPVRVSDTPGFIVNRVARPFYLEALRIVEAGGEPAALDAAIREAGFRMGPMELADLIGHDINLSVSESLFERYYYQPRFRPSHLQRSMVEAGMLGRKSGRGFYDYSGEQGAVENAGVKSSEDVALRTISCIVNEAFLTLSEGVATAEDIDKAMKLGANYPKGPFEWADEIGVDRVLETLDSLRTAYGDAYLASPLLRERASDRSSSD
ncbi:MAG TPA: 3-hydroxyacyl-CoA dehydrogenase NAD-binding domain-containing protein [Rubrobacteraceae bacterium]|nr:3-hydroxyacyl-CoA dehydrogenase NAD-binding domain-containing protein [Rubrobacteraceae bacterium]